MNFLASPTIVTAMAFSGRLSFNPMTDYLETDTGKFHFQPPRGDQLPLSGFDRGHGDYYPVPNPQPQPGTEVAISPTSQRLQALSPFESHFGPHNPRGLELPRLGVLMRVRGKCTTDHISAAGPWLKYKGHLENISENLR
jgi:homoaconitase